MSTCVLLPFENFTSGQPIAVMASTGSASGDTSSGGSSTPSSNHNYDSDNTEESHILTDEAFHICSFCKQPYNDPRVLNCLHSFCLYCLKVMQKKENPGFVECLKCKEITYMESGCPVKDTNPNLGVRRYIEKISFTREDNITCRSCIAGHPATSRCYECVMFLCDICTPQHRTLNLYANHQVVPLTSNFDHVVKDNSPSCSAHVDYLRPATQYCHVCRAYFCDECRHQIQFPTHKVVGDSSAFSEMMINIDIEKKMSHEKMTDYASGIKKLDNCTRSCIEDLCNTRDELTAAIHKHFDDRVEALKVYAQATNKSAGTMFKAHFEFSQKLEELYKFLDAQTKHALPMDHMQTKAFVEKILGKINHMKPELHQSLRFEVEYVPGAPFDASQYIGSVSVVSLPVDQQIPGYQQPIARPTSVNRSSTNQNNYGSADTNGYRPYSSFGQQSQTYQSTDNQVGFYGYERSQQRNSYDPFPSQSSYQRSSSSPMTVSQPNSASMVSDTVFDFSNLHVDSTSGTNSNYFSSSQNQNRPYQTWSNGIDGSTSAPDDIFTRSSLFQVPDGTGSSTTRAATPIRRTRMQFISKFGEYGNSQGQFTEPSGVAIDAENRLIVADTNNSRIQIFNIHGQFLSQFGSSSNSKLTYPNRIAVSKTTGKVVITERAPSHRVQTYTIDGRHLKTFGEDILQHPRGVAVDKEDNIIIIECKVMRVTIFSMEGALLDQFSLSKDLQFPNSVAVNDRREIFISDNRSHNVKVFNYQGILQRTIGQEGLTNYPIAVAINQHGQVVVADNHNNFNITVFEQDGQLVGGYESKTKHAQCFDLTVTDDGLAILTSKDFKVYCYPYQEDSPHFLQNMRR